HLARGQAAADLDDAVGQGRLAVVDVGDDGEIADTPHRVGHGRASVAADGAALRGKRGIIARRRTRPIPAMNAVGAAMAAMWSSRTPAGDIAAMAAPTITR